MRQNFLIYIALLIIPLVFANAASIKMISSQNNEVVLSYKPNFKGFVKVVAPNGEEFSVPKIDGRILNNNQFGAYRKLGASALLSVPAPDSYEIVDTKVIKSTKYSVKLAPVETPDTNNAPNCLLTISADKYYSNAPIQWAKISYSGISQNRYLADIDINAYEYLPSEGIINVPEEIIIKIRFNSIGYTPKSYDLRYAQNVLNVGTASDYLIPKANIKLDKVQKSLQVESLTQWAKIPVSDDGIYKVTASQLDALGIHVTKENVKSIKVYGNSGAEMSEKVSDAYKYAMDQQRIIVNTNADGTLKEVLFFGSGTGGFKYQSGNFIHYQNIYSNKNYYMLSYGGEDGLRAEPIVEPEGEPTLYPTSYKQRIFQDADEFNPFASGGGRTWFGQSFLSVQFFNQFYNLDKSGTVDYVFGFGQRSWDNGKVNCYENSNLVGTVYLSGVSGDYRFASMKKDKFSIPASNVSSDDRSKISFEYKPSGRDMAAVSYFDYYEIHYPRNFVPINNEIEYDIDNNTLKNNDIVEYSINGFTDKIYGFDITNKNNPQLLPNRSTTGGLFKFRDKLDSGEVFKQYFVSSALKSTNIESMDFENMMSEVKGADVIFVYNKEMAETAIKYKEYRESKTGLTVFLANTDEIYKEFGGGKADPTAIRDMIAWAYKNWQTKPRYVVLWGDGHCDYRNISTKAVNYVPTYQVSGVTPVIADEDDIFASDDYFARVEGEDSIVDLAIGRLPVGDMESSATVLQKIIDYEQNSDKGNWQTQMILLADDSFTDKGFDGSVYVDATELIWNNVIPDYILSNKMYHPIYPTERLSASKRRKPALNKAWTTEVNTTGASIVYWMGHGNPRVWSHEEIMDRDLTIPTLINSKKLFFCTAGTCTFGRFDDPNIKAGSEEMILLKTGGAIGVFAATRISYQGQNADLTEEYYKNLFDFNTTTGEYPTFGEALQYSKMVYHGRNDLKYILLGDPSVRPNFPKYSIKIDSLAGFKINAKDSVIKFKALQKIRITGNIINPVDSSISSNFNGTGIISMFDGDENASITDEDNTTYNFLAYGGALNKSSFNVSNGTFAIEFIIPKDISYSTKTGRIFLSAFESASLRSAKGFYNKFIINGTEKNPAKDTKGPDVSLYLDSREFKSGDIVSSAPLLIADLYDESGINTTGMGIGHKIEVWVDDNPLSIELTKKFSTSLMDSRRGTIEDILSGLTAGTHRVRMRVWDIYNNFSIAQTEFVIKDPNAPAEIFDVINYPNPFDNSTTIKFNHTAFPPYDVEIAIFNQIGVLVRTLQKTETALRTSEVPWDGKDENGNNSPSGAYYYRILLKEKNKISTSHGNMNLVK